MRPCSINASNRAENWFIRSRRSSKPQLMCGSESATDGVGANDGREGVGAKDCRNMLDERPGSNAEVMVVIVFGYLSLVL